MRIFCNWVSGKLMKNKFWKNYLLECNFLFINDFFLLVVEEEETLIGLSIKDFSNIITFLGIEIFLLPFMKNVIIWIQIRKGIWILQWWKRKYFFSSKYYHLGIFSFWYFSLAKIPPSFIKVEINISRLGPNAQSFFQFVSSERDFQRRDRK